MQITVEKTFTYEYNLFIQKFLLMIRNY